MNDCTDEHSETKIDWGGLEEGWRLRWFLMTGNIPAPKGWCKPVHNGKHDGSDRIWINV